MGCRRGTGKGSVYPHKIVQAASFCLKRPLYLEKNKPMEYVETIPLPLILLNTTSEFM